MRVLILGAEGMLGSELMRTIPDAYGTTTRIQDGPLFRTDITNPFDLNLAFNWADPQVVVNCAGIVKSECAKHAPARVEAVNGAAPHKIAEIAALRGSRVIHISTDCVFSGGRGNHGEGDSPDATDLYGTSKEFGELLGYEHCVTLRTSFIGRDRVHGRGLLEWLLSHSETARGYSGVMWSGLSTIELARVIGKVIAEPSLNRLYHVAGPKISKADLLFSLSKAYGLSEPVRVPGPGVDRTLNGSKFNQAMNYSPPSWTAMAEELARS